jgi:penicillin-insensitive murein DD-endopeptidase
MGEHHKGSIKNSYRFPRKGNNFRYFSKLSYYIMGNAYVNSKVHTSVLQTYEELDQKYPEKNFRLMECSKKKGGKMITHRTHQNGLSIDFMTPLLKKNKNQKHYDGLGFLRYTLDFNKHGRRNKKVAIDFNTMAEHLLLLDKNARKNGLKIKKVIFKIDLKDELFNTEYGKKLKAKGIYFAQNLTPILNKVHDDHYHVDFEILD